MISRNKTDNTYIDSKHLGPHNSHAEHELFESNGSLKLSFTLASDPTAKQKYSVSFSSDNVEIPQKEIVTNKDGSLSYVFQHNNVVAVVRAHDRGQNRVSFYSAYKFTDDFENAQDTLLKALQPS